MTGRRIFIRLFFLAVILAVAIWIGRNWPVSDPRSPNPASLLNLVPSTGVLRLSELFAYIFGLTLILWLTVGVSLLAIAAIVGQARALSDGADAPSLNMLLVLALVAMVVAVAAYVYREEQIRTATMALDKDLALLVDIADLIEGGRHELARDFTRGVLQEEHPAALTFELNRLLGLALLELGEYNEAVDAFTAAVEIAPDSHVGYLLRGTAWMEAGNRGRATQDFAQAARLLPELPDVLTAGGDAMYATGERDPAKQFYAAALQGASLSEVQREQIRSRLCGQFPRLLTRVVSSFRPITPVVDGEEPKEDPCDALPVQAASAR